MGSKNENKCISNGSYNNEKTAAHASDTLARKLIKNGEQKHKLNFPDNHIKIHPEKHFTSKFIGVCYHKRDSKWYVQRWSKNENKHVFNGYYDDEETAAHASDTLARIIMENGEQKLNLNFPDDLTKVYPAGKRPTSKFIGVSFKKEESKWQVQRWSKNENTNVSYRCYD